MWYYNKQISTWPCFIVEKKSARAIAGLSMGEFHSSHISRFYLKTFDYIWLFSPTILFSPDVKSAVYENIESSLKEQMDNGYSLYWIVIGKTDFFYKNLEKYRTKLDEIKMPYENRESEGGHIWTNWRSYLIEFSSKLF